MRLGDDDNGVSSTLIKVVNSVTWRWRCWQWRCEKNIGSCVGMKMMTVSWLLMWKQWKKWKYGGDEEYRNSTDTMLMLSVQRQWL